MRATVDAVASTDYSTTLAVPGSQGECVATVEHLLAAVSACRLDDLIIEIDGPEVPILDGSSQEFVDACVRCGAASEGLDAPARDLRPRFRRYLDVKLPVCVSAPDNRREAWLLPKSSNMMSQTDLESLGAQAAQAWRAHKNTFGLTLSADVDFSERGLHRCAVETSVEIRREVASARTFVSTGHSAAMGRWLARAASIVLFFSTMPVYHSTMVDYAFQTSGRATSYWTVRSRASRPPASRPLHGVRPGHALNVELLKELMSNEENYAVVDVSVEK